MQLWNDYEGRTIAEAYPLNKLVRPEGRSAFFLTTNGTGTQALVRLIEAHYDESEILNRWRAVSEIKQENLVAMRKFGEAELDGTPLVYAVMEPTEISLAELLENRTLTPEETRQLATSLVAALQALHERDFVHERVEPANILAAGEVVKLRSDCVREIVAGPEGPTIAELKANDAHALAVVLLQALTGRNTLQGSATLLPTPFDGIIRNGLSGKWGLAEMAAALGPVKPNQVAEAIAKSAPKPTPLPTQESKPASSPVAETKTVPQSNIAASAGTATPQSVSTAQRVSEIRSVSAATSDPKTDAAAVASSLSSSSAPPVKPLVPVQTPDVRHRIVRPVEAAPRRKRLWIAGAVGAVLLLILFWRLMRSEPTNGATAGSQPIPTLASPQPGDTPAANSAAAAKTKPTAAVGPKSSDTARTPAVASTNNAVAGARTQWRVVAFTFNHQDQAQQKADSLAKRDASLRPEVFTPSGHAPYLVTVGGPMTRDQAEAFKQKARNAGLPHDTYAQNYAH